MKQILLMRHAKSDWGSPDLKDFDRPLAPRGLKDAPLMGRYLRQIDQVPELLISSTAKRARQTTELLSETAGIEKEQLLWNEDLYYGGVRDYLAAIQAAGKDVSRIMLVGHNPLMEQTVSVLAGSEHSVIVRMSTASLVSLETMLQDWSSVQPAVCEFRWMMNPKILNKL